MPTNENGQKTTFWRFISQHNIEIPIIQRDYAQGRPEKKTIRAGFLNDLKQSILSGEELKLDYIYGAKESSSFFPLDGQQRLTTLWLLHWFIAFKEGKIEKKGLTDTNEMILNEVGDILSRFTYKTRESSNDFCRRLVEFAAENKYSTDSSKDIRSRICSNLWFFKSWSHDPTIKAMLTMILSLEDVFGKIETPLWEVLSGSACPVVFFSLDMDKYKLTDDLYIKMNARGKALTSFENFKADFIGHLERMVKEGGLDKKYIDPELGIPIKLDSAWTDIFWENHSIDFDIDELYFVFFNRFFFNEYMASVSESSIAVQNSDVYKYFYGESSYITDDTLIVYEKFEFYEKVINSDMLSSLYLILDNVKRCKYIKKLLEGEFINDDDDRRITAWRLLIPQYKDGEIQDFSSKVIKKVTEIEQRHRPILYAICKYIEVGDFKDEETDRISFHNWMRVCKNLTSDARLRNLDSLIQTFRKIKEISKYSHDIYDRLAALNASLPAVPANVLEAQFKEECEKAERIVEVPESQSEIEAIESMAFFNGQIRFVYRDGSGAVDWDDVPSKVKTIKRYFSSSGVNTVAFISKYISLLTDSYQFLDEMEISLRKSAWINILLKPDLLDVTHKILLCEDIDSGSGFNTSLDPSSEYYAESYDLIVRAQCEICDDQFLQFLCNSENDNDKNHPKVHLGSSKFIRVYQKNTKSAQKIYLVGNVRNKVLDDLYEGLIPEDRAHLKAGRIYTNSKVPELKLFRGKTIHFLYVLNDGSSNYELSWNEENEIRRLPDDNGDSELLFSADGFEDSEAFATKLNSVLCP